MTMAIQTTAGGAGAGTVDASLAAAHLLAIANLDTGFGLDALVGNLQPVTYAPTETGVCPTRLDALVNTDFSVDPTADIVVLPVGGNFVLTDGSLITTRAGTALPVGNSLNPSTSVLVMYDTSDNNGAGYCVARAGSGGDLDLPFPVSALLYHELSHAFRIVTTGLLALTVACDPASPEESAAIVDENDMRDQLNVLNATSEDQRDPTIHCGGSCGGGGGGSCCIVASVATGSPISSDVDALREIRDHFLRRTDIGFSFFRSLHHGYYAFSPQVATRIAARQKLRETVRLGFVEPLVRMLRIIEAFGVDQADDETLGLLVQRDLARPGSESTIAEIDRAVATCSSDLTVALDEDERWLAELLVERALPNEHVMWALIEPVTIYRELLRSAAAGEGVQALGASLRRRLDDWTGEMPISDEWGVYDSDRALDHLDVLDDTLLLSPASRGRFRRRLRRRFPDVTAISNACGTRRRCDRLSKGTTHG